MDNLFPRNSFIAISDGLIENIDFNNNTVTISYNDCINCRPNQQMVRLIIGNNTLILDENGNRITVRNLRTGMTVNATFSSAMTRSIPPQASAYSIQVVRGQIPYNTTVGRIIDINRQNRTFMTISNGNPSSTIRFNVPTEAIISDMTGRPIPFFRLLPGLRVRVHHASFMTASIPPQTTAFEIQIIR